MHAANNIYMNRGLIVETDIGRDPDDLFALCYLIGSGTPVRAITVSPGDPDQIALVRWLLKELDLTNDVLVGAGIPNRTKSSVTGIHTTLLKRYGAPLVAQPDMDGAELMRRTLQSYPNADVFASGPLSSLGRWLRSAEYETAPVKRVFMQGGFVQYRPDHTGERLPKFEGKRTVGTFNMNGDVQGTLALVSNPNITRRFVGKNVCHTVTYDRKIHERVTAVPPHNREMEIFREGMGLYLDKHPAKLFHDPAAAVCFTNPEIAKWVPGRVIRDRDGWGTEIDECSSDLMAVDIDRDRLWHHVAEFI